MENDTLKGWRGIGPEAGKFVRVDDGFDYVAHQVGILGFHHTAPLAAEFEKMLVEWFFSGNWLEVREDG